MPKLRGDRPAAPVRHAFLPTITSESAAALGSVVDAPASLKRAIAKSQQDCAPSPQDTQQNGSVSAVRNVKNKRGARPGGRADSSAEMAQMQRIMQFGVFKSNPVETILAHQDATQQLRSYQGRPNVAAGSKSKPFGEDSSAAVRADLAQAAQPVRRQRCAEVPDAVERGAQKRSKMSRSASSQRKVNRSAGDVLRGSAMPTDGESRFAALEAAAYGGDELDGAEFPLH